MTDDRIFFKKADGTFIDNGDLLSCICHYDDYGTYIGQEQLNCIGDANEPPILFFAAKGNESGYMSMTQEQMENAYDYETQYATIMSERGSI